MGGEVVRKKQSDGERRWEVGESEEERMGEGKGGIFCGLAVALVVNLANANSIAEARFRQRRYY